MNRTRLEPLGPESSKLLADCPPEPEPRVKRQRETIVPIPRKDDYAPKPPMTLADIRAYWERHAPQAKQKAKR